MRLQAILSAVRFEPWAITPSGYNAVAEILQRAITGQIKAEDSILDQLVNRRPEMSIDGNGNATVHVFGTLLAKSTAIERTCGNTDYAQIRQEITAAKSMGATSITLAIDSPGGMVQGVRATADAIRDAGLPTVALIDGLGCSAAYWLASQCDEVVATQDSMVGSIGVIMPWIDKDGLWEDAGIAWNPITNDGATMKGAGGGPSLTDEQREFLTARANRDAADFHAAVKRRTVADEVFSAGSYGAIEAGELGLVDRIV